LIELATPLIEPHINTFQSSRRRYISASTGGDCISDAVMAQTRIVVSFEDSQQ